MTPLDPIDRQLIEALQRDGRASYADLAELVGLSPAATRLRVQRLLDAGVRPKTLMRRQEDEGQRQRRNCTIPGNVDGPRTAHPVVCAAVQRLIVN